MKDRPVLSLRVLAKTRLDKLRAEPEEVPEDIKRMRAEGWLFLGDLNKGFIILPPESD